MGEAMVTVVAPLRMGHIHQEAAIIEAAVFQEILGGENRAARHVDGRERLHHLELGALARPASITSKHASSRSARASCEANRVSSIRSLRPIRRISGAQPWGWMMT